MKFSITRLSAIFGITAIVCIQGVQFYGFSVVEAGEPVNGLAKIVRLDPAFDQIVPSDVTLDQLADGFTWVEGPVWNHRDQSLVFSDIPNNSVFRWKHGNSVSLFLNPSGYTGSTPYSGFEPGSNGLTFDKQGRLVLCQHGNRAIARLETNGDFSVLADRYEGKRLNSPNDLVYKSNGDLYFTDPPFGLPKAFDDPDKELPFQGVYRISSNGSLTLLLNDIKAPNGIAFSPDEKILYVTDVDPQRSAWLAYDVKADGTLENGRVFADATPWRKDPYFGPDGVKVDRKGNVWGARPGGINIFAPDGILLGMIEINLPTSNLNWGEDGSVLFITGGSKVFRLPTTTLGAVSLPASH